jgi:hypothetical protein
VNQNLTDTNNTDHTQIERAWCIRIWDDFCGCVYLRGSQFWFCWIVTFAGCKWRLWGFVEIGYCLMHRWGVCQSRDFGCGTRIQMGDIYFPQRKSGSLSIFQILVAKKSSIVLWIRWWSCFCWLFLWVDKSVSICFVLGRRVNCGFAFRLSFSLFWTKTRLNQCLAL